MNNVMSVGQLWFLDDKDHFTSWGDEYGDICFIVEVTSSGYRYQWLIGGYGGFATESLFKLSHWKQL